ncbi:MAG: hypothetical protein ACRDG7_00440 [Candidatus Limnocylindria bacterium]
MRFDGTGRRRCGRLRLVVVNGSADAVDLIVEQPTGQVDRLPMQPCGSHSTVLGIDQFWQGVVVNGIVLESTDVFPLAARFTVLRVDVSPAGELEVANSQPAQTQPDAPLDFNCARP